MTNSGNWEAGLFRAKPFMSELSKKEEKKRYYRKRYYQDMILKEKCPKCSNYLRFQKRKSGFGDSVFIACSAFPKCYFARPVNTEEYKLWQEKIRKWKLHGYSAYYKKQTGNLFKQL